MHELLWITICWSRVGWFANDFHEWRSAKWRSHEWKSLANHITSDKNRYSRWGMYYFISYTLFYVLNTPFRYKQSSIAHFVIVAKDVFSDLTLWRHHSWSVTSSEREVMALWRHIRQLFLHAQIGAKAIFNIDCEEQQWISISHHPAFTAWRKKR